MPDTTNYMVLGYAIIVIILVAIVLYLVLKARHLRADEKMLEAIEDEDQTKSERPTEVIPEKKANRGSIRGRERWPNGPE